MKKTPIRTKLLSLLAVALTFIAVQATAQTTFQQSGESYVTISGTSTLHNWTMTSKEPVLSATFETTPEGALSQLKSLSFTVSSTSLKSAHSAMDKNAYSALKTDKNKVILFKVNSATIQKNLVQCSGTLSVAGVTKPMNVEANCQQKQDGQMSCTGSKAFKMSDFQVEAPSFMFGTVTTGDEITISFNLQLSPVKTKSL